MSAAGIGLLIIAHIADYTTFVFMVARHGLGAEANPLVAMLAVLFVAATFLIVGRTRPRLAAGVLAFGIFIGSLGAVSNVATI
jgi:hypothetical protein